MDLVTPPPDIARVELAAMKAVAMANGSYDDAERYLLAAAARVLSAEADLAGLAPAEPAAVAAALATPAHRHQLVHALIATSMVDGEASDDESLLVESFANALAIGDEELARMRRRVVEQMLCLRFDLMRRVWSLEQFEVSYHAGGLTALLRIVGSGVARPEDEALAERFGALEHFPRDSFGRAYHDHCRTQGFALPGERRGPPEVVLLHDLTHVLTGYGTDPAGEVETAAFTAGNRHDDPFSHLFFVLLQFYLGVHAIPLAKPEVGFYDRARIAGALERGERSSVELGPSWDYWALMSEPLGDVRRACGIDEPPPRT